MINKINSLLAELKPFILLIALVFGFMAAWLAVADIFPIVKQIWTPNGTAQSHAIVGACLAIIAGRA